MGLFGRMKDPVEGIAQVVSASALTEHAHWASCRLQVVLQAPGLEARPVAATVTAPGKKWPWPGTQLPVRIDRAKPDKFKVLWDKVESTSDQASRQAQAMADLANQGGVAPDPPGGAGPTDVQAVLGQLGGMAPGANVDASSVVVTGADAADAVRAVEQALGRDLDGDGVVGPGSASGSTSASASDDDRLARLERLAALHAQGALSDEEYATEKRRLLGT